MGITFRIEDMESFVKILRELRKKGFIKELPSDISLDDGRFPMIFEIDTEKLLSYTDSPIIKPFNKKIDKILTKQIMKIIN